MYELIKRNNFQGFSTSLIRRFAYSLLHCLKLLRRERIIHCDLKPVSLSPSPSPFSFLSLSPPSLPLPLFSLSPLSLSPSPSPFSLSPLSPSPSLSLMMVTVPQENILLKLKGQSSIKVIDFGSSCYDHQRVYTYIQSRFYRSPEVILGALPRIHHLSNSLSLYVNVVPSLPPSLPPSLLLLCRDAVQHGHRHVESGVHLGRAVHGLPAVPRGERGGTASLHHGDIWSPLPLSPQRRSEKEALLR